MNNVARIMLISEEGQISEYVNTSLEILSEEFNVVLDIEKSIDLDISDKQIPIVIFDNVRNESINSEVVKMHLNQSSCFFVYIKSNLTEAVMNDVLDKNFDLIIDERHVTPKTTAYWLRNVLNRISYYTKKPEIIQSDDIKVNLPERKVWKSGEEIRLTDIEFRMLTLFVKNPNQVLSIKFIFKEIWGIDDDDTSRIVTQYIHRLKAKIGKEHIANISNIGYIWNMKK